MTNHLPEKLESSILAVVHGGQFASVDDAMAEAARLLLRQCKRATPAKALTEDDLDRQMLADGLLTQLPNTAQDSDDEDEDEAPVTIKGEPLSETIICERR